MHDFLGIKASSPPVTATKQRNVQYSAQSLHHYYCTLKYNLYWKVLFHFVSQIHMLDSHVENNVSPVAVLFTGACQ